MHASWPAEVGDVRGGPAGPGPSLAQQQAAEATQRRREEDRIIQKAQRIRAMHGNVNAAMREPYKDPPMNQPAWDYVLKEARWMCTDFMQERRFKHALAAQLARLCAKRVRGGKGFLHPVKEKETGDHAYHHRLHASGLVGKVRGRADPATRGRGAAHRAAGDADVGPLTPPDVDEALPLVYDCDADVVTLLLRDLEAAEKRRQVEFEDRLREYEIELEAARRIVAHHKVKEAQEELLRANLGDGGLELDSARFRKGVPKVRLPSSKRPLSTARPARRDEDVEMDGAGRSRRPQPKPGPAQRAAAAQVDPRSRAMLQRQKDVVMRTQAMLRTPPWSKEEEKLFLCIINEFGLNWALVADVQSSSNALQGLHRRADGCKSKFRMMTNEVSQAHQGEHVSLEVIMASRGVNKNTARDVLAGSLPVPDSTLKRHLSSMLEIGKKLMSQRVVQRPSREELFQLSQATPHGSHLQVKQMAASNVGAGTRSLPQDPLDLLRAQKTGLAFGAAGAGQALPAAPLDAGVAAAAAAPPAPLVAEGRPALAPAASGAFPALQLPGAPLPLAGGQLAASLPPPGSAGMPPLILPALPGAPQPLGSQGVLPPRGLSSTLPNVPPVTMPPLSLPPHLVQLPGQGGGVSLPMPLAPQGAHGRPPHG